MKPLHCPWKGFWCCLCVWHLMYKLAWPCCGAQRETVNRRCCLSVLYPCTCVPFSAWMFSTAAFWIIAQQKDLWHRQPWCACPKQFGWLPEKQIRVLLWDSSWAMMQNLQRVDRELLRVGAVRVIWNQKFKKCREWTRYALQNFTAVVKWKERWEKKLANMNMSLQFWVLGPRKKNFSTDRDWFKDE